MKTYILDNKLLTKETITKTLTTDFYFWWDKEFNILNFKYKHCRLQLLFPFIVWKGTKGIYFDTLISFSLKKSGFVVYKHFGLQLLGFGICIEYHIPTDEQLNMQENYINKLIKLNKEDSK